VDQNRLISKDHVGEQVLDGMTMYAVVGEEDIMCQLCLGCLEWNAIGINILCLTAIIITVPMRAYDIYI
jgi:hypothetical protein